MASLSGEGSERVEREALFFASCGNDLARAVDVDALWSAFFFVRPAADERFVIQDGQGTYPVRRSVPGVAGSWQQICHVFPIASVLYLARCRSGSSGRSRPGPAERFVDNWIKSLDGSARAEVAWTIDLLKQHGTALSLPFVRYVGDGVWELRARDVDGIYRVLYFHWKGRTFGLLHGFTKKTQATPTRELDLAKSRRAVWLSRTGTKGRPRDG